MDFIPYIRRIKSSAFFPLLLGLMWNGAFVYLFLNFHPEILISDTPISRDPASLGASVILGTAANFKEVGFMLSLSAFYGILSMLQFLIQYFASNTYLTRELLALEKNKNRVQSILKNKTIVIVVPCFNENPILLKKSLESCMAADFEGRKFISVIDDKSTRNIEELEEVFKWAESLGVHVFRKNINEGKRKAQKLAFDHYEGKVDYYVTIDSDTVLFKDALTEISVKLLEHPRNAAGSGEVLAYNPDVNFLTKLIDCRYWSAFNLERASQAQFGSMFCCSGPFSIYRARIIDKVKERYVTQKFFGIECTYGDDRHLTNLVLGEGLRVVYAPSAKALTEVPESVSQFIKQQIRWNKSFYREIFFTPFLKRKSLYLCFELSCQLILPILLLISLVSSVYHGLLVDHTYAWIHLWWFVLVAFIKTGPGFVRTLSSRFLIFPLYAIIHLSLLVPVRIYAILTINDGKWGTR